ncbi:MAG: pyrophosphatase [bacterium]|nr:pyrophosphatase [bacterium]
MSEMKKLLLKTKKVMTQYLKEFPEVRVNRDYFPFKLTEEWGECIQTYLMLTGRGRLKGKTKTEIGHDLADEMADVLGFLLLFADNEKINLVKALEKKWFKRLKK